MKDQYFSISQLAESQGISRQTLIHYDRIGLFHPAHVNPDNGYREYSPSQLDELETIMMLKHSGLSLDEMKAALSDYSTESSLKLLESRIQALDEQVKALQETRRRLSDKVAMVDKAMEHEDGQIVVERVKDSWIVPHPVKAPYSLEEVSLATKECLVKAFAAGLKPRYQLCAFLPLEALEAGRFLDTDEVFLPCDESPSPLVRKVPGGLTASIWHRGSYGRTPEKYRLLSAFCEANGLEMISGSYEYALNDHLTTKDKSEYMTRLQVFVRPL